MTLIIIPTTVLLTKINYYGQEHNYITNLIASVSCNDRIWIVRQIVRNATEFGVCKDLGANIFNYFIIHDLKDVDFIMCILLEEIIITLAISSGVCN